MTLDELMEIVEIENLDEFEFFEHFSALMECHEEIEFSLFAKVLSEVEADLLHELTDNYFEDIMQGIPDDSMNLYTLFYSIRTALCEAAKEADSQQDRAYYINELYRFRNWYMFDSSVRCKRISDGLETEETLFDALALYRMEKLGEEKYEYDFSAVLDYYIDSFENIPEDEDYDSGTEKEYDEEDEFNEGLIDRHNPVIDGEYEDEDEEDQDPDH